MMQRSAENVGTSATSFSLIRRIVGWSSSRRVFDRIDAALGRDAHALGAVRVRGDPHAGAVRLLDRGARLIRRVRGELRAGALSEDTAGGEQLDDHRADGDLLARRRAHGVGSVRDATDLHAVTTGDRDATRGRDDAWSFEGAALDLARELDDH